MKKLLILIIVFAGILVYENLHVKHEYYIDNVMIADLDTIADEGISYETQLANYIECYDHATGYNVPNEDEERPTEVIKPHYKFSSDNAYQTVSTHVALYVPEERISIEPVNLKLKVNIA